MSCTKYSVAVTLDVFVFGFLSDSEYVIFSRYPLSTCPPVNEPLVANAVTGAAVSSVVIQSMNDITEHKIFFVFADFICNFPPNLYWELLFLMKGINLTY